MKKERLNVALVGSRFPVWGAAARQSFLYQMAQSLSKKGHKVTILSWQNPKNLEEFSTGQIRAYFLGHNPGAKRKNFHRLVEVKFAELHAQEPFDIVHSLDSSALRIAKNKKRYKVKVTFDVACTRLSEMFAILAMKKESVSSHILTAIALAYKYMTTFWSLDRPLLKKADAVFVTTPLQKLALERYYLYPEKSIYLVPYGSEVVHLSPRQPNQELRQKLGLPSQSPVFITLSDMNEKEEMVCLLEAFARVVTKKPSCRLLVVGNGPLFKDIEFEMLSRALGNKVIMTGALSAEELHEYLIVSDVYVNLSARTSGFEPSMLEAMAFEKIVIGSELSPIANIIENNVDGFLVRPAAVSEIENLMLQLVSVPATELKNEYKSIGAKARKKVLELFDPDQMSDKLLLAFDKIL